MLRSGYNLFSVEEVHWYVKSICNWFMEGVREGKRHQFCWCESGHWRYDSESSSYSGIFLSQQVAFIFATFLLKAGSSDSQLFYSLAMEEVPAHSI